MNEREHDINFKNLFIPLTTKKILSFLFIIGFVLFFNGLFNNFVADDPPEITENPIIQSIANVSYFFSGSLFYVGPGMKLGGSFYRPLQSTYFALIYTFFGPNFVAYHFFQLLFYIANACLVSLLLKRILKKELTFVLSLLFLIHPINSESAYYISAMQEVLFFFFGMIAILLVQRYHSHKIFIAACFFLFCSILSKESGILFFLMTFLSVFLSNKRKSFYFLGYLAVTFALYAVLRIYAIGIIPATTSNAPIQILSLSQRLINIPEIFLFYITTFFYPKDLAVSYHWVITNVDLQHFFLPMLLDIVFISIIVMFAYHLYKKKAKNYTAYFFFLCWFFAGIVMHLQLLPLDHTVTDQWFYFPFVGLIGMIGIALQQFKINLRNKYAIAIIIVLLIALAFRTYIRSFDWRNDFTLAKHDSQISKSYALEHILSHIYFVEGNYEEAKRHALLSIEYFPYVFNYTDLGNAELNLGEYAQAEKNYKKALQYGDYFATYDNLAALYINYGNEKEGITFVKKALKKYPFDQRLWLYLAVLEYRDGDKTSAKQAIQKAVLYNQGIAEVVPVYNTIMQDQPLHFHIGVSKN